MMSLEGPYVSAIIARISQPTFNLAAYGVAFAFALILEAPIIMIMSASTALVKSFPSLSKLFRFTLILNIVITLFTLVILIPNIFYFITESLLHLPVEVANLTHTGLLLLIPWPAAIGFRRFYQGILIRNSETRKVAYGTVVRLASMSISAALLAAFTDYPGVVVGAASLSIGVVLEAFASRWMVHKQIERIKTIVNWLPEEKRLTYKDIAVFYYPLALTSMLSLGVHPMVTFFLGKSKLAIESLAVLPVVNSFIFLFRSIGLSYQEVAIALVGDTFENYKEIRKFAFYLAGGVLCILSLTAFTPLADFWYRIISGLKPELAKLAISATKILVLLPALTVWLSMQRSILVAGNFTRPITFATSIEVIGILLALAIAVLYLNIIGVIAAAFAFVLGRIGANIYLLKHYRNIIKKKYSIPAE
ncbi:MAG: hypothetical protein Kow00108_24870 [Calditrichia bacterium]